jgi:hypothetical protein
MSETKFNPAEQVGRKQLFAMDKSIKIRKGESIFYCFHMQMKCMCFTISVIDKSKFIEIVRQIVPLRDRRNEAWITWEMPIVRRKEAHLYSNCTIKDH